MLLDKPRLRRADASTIQDKFLVGYQGWFTCGGDGEPVGPGHHGWLHWFNYPVPDGGHPNTDIWPDVSEYSPSELYAAAGLRKRSGEQCFLFSSRHPKTVDRHFHWMAEHGVDGAFLQRFLGQCDTENGENEGIQRIRDEVGDRVRESAEKEGRVFAIMYDVTGVAPDRIQRVIERDWSHLVRHKAVLDSPCYLRERGKAVVAIWGLGFEGRNHSPSIVRAITSYLRDVTPGGVYIMAGVPAHWRTSSSDADPNPDFLDVWLKSFDAISPWTIGRYSNEHEADRFAEEKIKGDVHLIKQTNDAPNSIRKIDYIPVVFPGGSGYNMTEGVWGRNDIKRNGGRFLWQQLFNVRRHGARIIYGAMWDEYDEGTAFMPVVPHKNQLPVSDRFTFLALDIDGYDLPADWFMRICGFGAEGLRGERRIHESFPLKELQDYWATRPHYEQSPSSSGLSPDIQVAVVNPDEPPPPPYVLEVGEVGAASTPSPALARASSASSAIGSRPSYTVDNLADDMSRQSLAPSPFSARSASTPPQPPVSNTNPFRRPPSHPSLVPGHRPSPMPPAVPSPTVYVTSPPDPYRPEPPQRHPESTTDHSYQSPHQFKPGYQPSYLSFPPAPSLPPRPTSSSVLSSPITPSSPWQRTPSPGAFPTSPPPIPSRPSSSDISAYTARGYPGGNDPGGFPDRLAYGPYVPPPMPPPSVSAQPYSDPSRHNSPGQWPAPYPPQAPYHSHPGSGGYTPPPPTSPMVTSAKNSIDMLFGKQNMKKVQSSVQNMAKQFKK